MATITEQTTTESVVEAAAALYVGDTNIEGTLGERKAAEMKSTTVARRLLLGTTCGDLILYLLFRGEISHRDARACALALVLIMLLTSFESPKARKGLTSKRFRRIFATLSAMEVVFTILVPWTIILTGITNQKATQQNGHLLAAHLFIFQAQIAFECVIALAGETRKWLMFPFTCAANAYRGSTIATWIWRVLEEDAMAPRDVIIPAITTCLWLYSSFVFIPREWYPLLKEL